MADAANQTLVRSDPLLPPWGYQLASKGVACSVDSLQERTSGSTR